MSSTIDPSHNSQIQITHPQNQLIATKLTENKYLIWKQQLLTAIRGYGLEGFINGNKKPPPEFTESTNDEGNSLPTPSLEYDAWLRQDQLLASWILSSLSENLLGLMVGLSSLKEMWEALALNFASQSQARRMQHKLELQNLKKGSMSMRDFLTKVKSCCDVLASIGERISEDQCLKHSEY